MERLHKFYTEDLCLRASAAVTTEVVKTMCESQGLFPLAAMGLGRTLTGALLLASQLKEGQKISLTFHGNGPLGSLYAEATFEAEARGFCANPQAHLPLRDGHVDVAGGVGQGVLTVVRSQPFQKQPHAGIVPIASGDIGQDLAHYLYQSHQIPSIVSLSVSLDEKGQVCAAGGVLVELLPGATDSLITVLEEKLKTAGSLARGIQAGRSPLELVKRYVHDSKLVPMEHPYPIAYTCKCSIERVERTLLLLGREAIEEMLAKGKETGVQCQFCGKQYSVSTEDLRLLWQQTLFPAPSGTPPH